MVRTRGLSWAMFWAVISYLVTTLGTMLTNYFTSANVTPLQGSLISTSIGLLVVIIGVLIDRAKGAVPPPPEQPTGKQPSRLPWVAVILAIVLLCGCGGVAVTYAAQWAGSKIVNLVECGASWLCKEKEPAEARLAAPVTRKTGTLAATVTKVDVTKRATLVTLTVQNAGPAAVNMPQCQLTVPGVSTLPRDPLSGDWEDGTVPASGERTGLLVFDGIIGPDVAKVTLSFTQIYGQDFNAPRSMTIDIPLTTTS